MGRRGGCPKMGLKRGSWTASEDKILTDYINLHGEGKWRQLPINAGLKRCGKSCRLRWLNYLKPDIKRGNISWDEEDLIIRLHKLLGNRWSLIAGRLPGRTDNEIKNYWNTTLAKKHNQSQHLKQDKETRSNMNVEIEDPAATESPFPFYHQDHSFNLHPFNIDDDDDDDDEMLSASSTITAPMSKEILDYFT